MCFAIERPPRRRRRAANRGSIRVDAAPVERRVQHEDQFAARPRRHRAAAHAIGHDVDGRRPVECAVRILVDRVAPAAAGSDGEPELRPPRREQRGVGDRGALPARSFAPRGPGSRGVTGVMAGGRAPTCIRVPCRSAPQLHLLADLPSELRPRRVQHAGTATPLSPCTATMALPSCSSTMSAWWPDTPSCAQSITSAWLRERPMRNGSGSSGRSTLRSPEAMRTVTIMRARRAWRRSAWPAW